MSTNYLVNVPKLKGRENYPEWCFAAENFLILENMEHCIKPVTRKIIEAADDARTKAKLILTIDSSLYVHIKEVKTSLELWNKLKALFDDSGFTRRISLLRNLISIRLENCSSMTSYVTQLVETGQKLSGTGFQISDEWIGCLLLAGLTEKYAPMIMAIEHSGIAITTDAIKSKLMDLDENNGGDANGAFASFRKNKVGSTGHGGNKDNGHSQTSTSMSKSKKIPRCYRCKQIGHYRNQCTVDKYSSNTKSSERKQTNAFNAVFLNGRFSRNDWYVDSGASAHLTSNENWIKNVSTEYSIKEIVVANEEKLSVKCSGDVQIATVTDDSEYDVIVKGVLCVPKLTTNLLSVSQLVKNGNQVVFTTSGCNIYNRNGQLVAMASLTNGVYKLRTSESTLATMFVSVDTWHRRLGHVNSMYLNKMPDAVSGMELEKKSDISQSSCIVCCEGKQSRLPFGHAGSRSSELLGIIHSDVCGPMENASIGGSRYFILFIDDYSRMTYIYFMKQKSEAFQYFQDYKAKVENQLNRKIKILRSDNGKEFCCRSFDDYLKKNGILHQKSNPYTPEQNGLAERSNRTIVEKAKCLLFDAKLSKEFWAEASNTAVYLHNRTVLPVLNDKTPYEIWSGRKPDIGHLRIFGSRVMVHVAKEKRLKWDKKSEKKILVGYPEDIKGYRVYCPITKKVSTSRDVIIMEEVSIPVTENRECNEESLGSVGDISSGDLEDNVDETYIDKSDVTYIPSEYESVSSSESGESEHDGKPVRLRQKPERYEYLNMCADSNVKAWDCWDANDAGDLTVQEALVGPEKELWLSAIREELKCFSENDAWELVDAPSAGTVVKCKWVLKKKYCNEQVRYRARLVAKGFTQRPGVDYYETFSPVIRHSTLRYLFALSVQLKMDITHLDVTTAFLNGHLKETIFMQLPECFPNVNCNKVLRLKKAIYGLKQASLAWYDRVNETLCNLGYVKSTVEPCVFLKDCQNNRKVIVGLYVDDFLIFSNVKSETDKLIEALNAKFKIKNLGDVKQYLGMRVNVDRKNCVITLDQEQYIEQLMHKFNMSDCHTAETPIECKLNIEKSSVCKDNVPYQRLIGCLMYLAVLTRPDIAYSVSYLSQFNNCYSDVHFSYAKRVLRYLYKTKHYCLKYSQGTADLVGYVDADWANDMSDRRSYTGFCFLKSGSAISWESRKQRTVALSSCEAEYMALSEACREAIHLRRLEIEIVGFCNKVILFNDSQSALKLANSHQSYKRSKHIDVRYNFIKEVIDNEIVETKYVGTSEMPADLLTKGLPRAKHYKFMEILGLLKI